MELKMITSQKFAANLRAFSKLDDMARELYAETAAYVLFQFHAHGNKDPLTKLQNADLPAWVKDGFKKLTMGKRDKAMTERNANMRGDALAAQVFAGQSEKRQQAKFAREAKAKEAPKANEAKANETIVKADFILASQGVVTELSKDEYAALAAYLIELRSPKLLVVNG
jgi:hypothetical protein